MKNGEKAIVEEKCLRVMGNGWKTLPLTFSNMINLKKIYKPKLRTS